MSKPPGEINALANWIASHPEWEGFYQALGEFVPKTFQDAMAIADEQVSIDANSLDMNPSALHTYLQIPHRDYLRALATHYQDAASRLLAFVETALDAMESVDTRTLPEDDPVYDLYGFSIAGFVRDLEEDEETRRLCLRFIGPRAAVLLRDALNTGNSDMRIGDDFEPLQTDPRKLLPGST